MHQKHGERIPPGISMSTQFLERSDALLGVLVPGLGIASEDGFSLLYSVTGKIRDKFFYCHIHSPVRIFSIACSPKRRCSVSLNGTRWDGAGE